MFSMQFHLNKSSKFDWRKFWSWRSHGNPWNWSIMLTIRSVCVGCDLTDLKHLLLSLSKTNSFGGPSVDKFNVTWMATLLLGEEGMVPLQRMVLLEVTCQPNRGCEIIVIRWVVACPWHLQMIINNITDILDSWWKESYITIHRRWIAPNQLPS